MTTSKSKKAPPANPSGEDAQAKNPDVLRLERDPGESESRMLAEVALSPVLLNTLTARLFNKNSFGVTDLTEAFKVLQEHATQTQEGDLSRAKELLYTQAVALNAIFVEMCRRGALNMGEYLQPTDTYMRIALKAQSQSRATLETLAEIENPKSVAFVRQANIANGPQQVNNGANVPENEPLAPTGNSTKQSNELLECFDAQRLDDGSTRPAAGADTQMEAVAPFDRTKD